MEEKHLLHYLILVLGLSVFVFLFVYFRYFSALEPLMALLGCVFYSLWGIIHHAMEGRLTKFIALEYVLISCVVFLLIFTALSV